MEYEWNPQKARSNLQKHGIDFADAVSVFADDFALTIAEDHPDEARWIAIAMDAFGRILVVVYTHRGNRIRLISARKASKAERQHYEELR